MSDDNVVSFVSQADKLLAFSDKLLSQIKAGLAMNDPIYLLNISTIDHYIKISGLSKDLEFSHQQQMLEKVLAFNVAIKGNPWIDQFRASAGARANELKAIALAKIAEERGKNKRFKYEDCKKGEYATYDYKTALPHATFLNAQLVFRDLGIVGAYNSFTEKKTFLKEGKEVHIGQLRNLIWDFVFVDFPHKTLEMAIDAYCRRFEFHPILDYFKSIEECSCENKLIDSWLTTTLGAEDSELTREIGRKMLVAMVARIKNPGTKFDQMIVFESSQGVGKSTLLEILAGTEYFNSGAILRMEAKEQMEALKGRIIYESAELVGHGRADVDAVKAFLSATSDRGRWAYATEVRDHPRTSIIVGTTNKDNYLLDETGNRRVWPIQCCVVPTATVYDGVLCPKEANLQWLREHRDELWREAIQLYDEGYSLVLDRSLWGDMAEIQTSRMADIPLADDVMDIFAFTEHEGLFITDDGSNEYLELRIFTKDIIDQLFPNNKTNRVMGREVKSAMLSTIVAGQKWTYKIGMKIHGIVNTGYLMTIGNSETKREVLNVIDARRKWRARRNIDAATI